MTGPRPTILEQPNIPPPLHGLNPRSLMGPEAWDRMRREVYRSNGHCCVACGTHAGDAIIRPGIEAHEDFEIDYAARRMTLRGMVPLCHACHSFVHGGLLEVNLMSRKVSREQVATILGHGIGILSQCNGTIPPAAAKLCRQLQLSHDLPVSRHPRNIPWEGWTMVWNCTTYRSRYPTRGSWERAMKNRSRM